MLADLIAADSDGDPWRQVRYGDVVGWTHASLFDPPPPAPEPAPTPAAPAQPATIAAVVRGGRLSGLVVEGLSDSLMHQEGVSLYDLGYPPTSGVQVELWLSGRDAWIFGSCEPR